MNVVQRLTNDFEKNYVANSVLGIIVSSCLGSITAMLILKSGSSFFHVVHLGWIIIVCMLYNAAVLVGLKSKMVFYLQILSVLSSILTIAYYILL